MIVRAFNMELTLISFSFNNRCICFSQTIKINREEKDKMFERKKLKMKKTIKTISIIALTLVLTVAMLAACGNSPTSIPETAPAETAPAETKPAETAPAPEESSLGGDVIQAGSTSVQPVSQELADAFMDIHSKVIIDIQGGGSGQGVKAVEEDLVDFGALSRELKDEEMAVVKHDWVIAKDGIAIVVNQDVDVDDLTKDQIKDIFTGVITNWSEVGGASAKIEVVVREEGSGTRDAFNELTGVLGKDADGNNVDNTVETALIQGSTGAIVQTVGATEHSIGYISLGSLNDSVSVLKVEGVAPSAATVLDGSYVVSRPFILITGRDLSAQAQAFIDFIMGPEGQSIVSASGIVPVA